MRTFNHLNLLEREKMFGWKKMGLSNREIGQRLNRHHTSIGREIKKNVKYGKTYYPCLSQKRAERVGHRQRWHAPLKDPLIFLYVREHLREFWSPETIAGRLPLDHRGYSVDKETVYRYVYHQRNHREKLWQYLTLARKKRMRKEGRRVHRQGKIPGAVSIDLRAKSVMKRKRFGHFESDNLEGLRSDKSVVSVTVERKARKIFLSKLDNRKSKDKTQAVIARLSHLPEKFRQTLTLDNGSENSGHIIVAEALKLNVYFCHAYHSWEKGTVENTIGRIRRFIPKGESLNNFSEEMVTRIEERFNNTPRKCLKFLTPNEVEAKILSTTKSF